MAAKSKPESKEKLNKALKEANDAALELGADFKNALTDDYQHLVGALGETNVAKRLGAVKDKIGDYKDQGVEKVKALGEQVDENVHQNPYHFIAGAAAAGLILGLLIGRKI